MRWVKVALLATGLVLARPGHAETMYARFPTSVRSERSLSAEVVKELRQGDRVQILAREGRHYKVRADGEEGWVYFNKLTDKKPEDVMSLLSSGLGGAGIELTELEAGGAVRGLSRSARSYVAAGNVPDWVVRAVEEMQAMKITSAELEAFKRAGRLGEYGEEGM